MGLLFVTWRRSDRHPVEPECIRSEVAIPFNFGHGERRATLPTGSETRAAC